MSYQKFIWSRKLYGYKSIENPDNSKDFDSIRVYNVSDAELSEETSKEQGNVERIIE